MDEQAKQMLSSAFDRAVEVIKRTQDNPEEQRRAHQNYLAVKRNTQAYLEKLEVGQIIAVNRLRDKHYRGLVA